MAIRLISGAIGSGKTYYAVKHVLDQYASWDDDLDKWVLNDDVCIYSNIDGLLIGHDLMSEVEKAGGLNPFFTLDFQKKFVNNKRVIYIIDEAQGPMLFHRKFYDANVFYFFQYSRHLGIDIYLIVQDVDSLAREIRCLPEYNIQAVRRTLAMGKEFRYKFMTGDDVFKTKILSRKPEVFSAYRSMITEETEKQSSAPKRFLLLFGASAVLGVLVFFFVFIPAFTGGPNVATAQGLQTKVPQASLPASLPVFLPVSLPEKTVTPQRDPARVETQKPERETREFIFAGFFEDRFLLNDGIYTAATAQAIYHRVFAVDVRTGFLTVDGVSYSVGSLIKL